jgi:hypothetical protein
MLNLMLDVDLFSRHFIVLHSTDILPKNITLTEVAKFQELKLSDDGVIPT